MGVPGYDLAKAEEVREDAVEEEFTHLLVWYGDIRARAPRGQHFEPIELQAIAIYEDRFLAKLGIEMTALDWDLLMRLDAIWQDCVPKS